MTDKQPLWVRCECTHKWVAAWTPMSIDIFGQLLTGLRCPMCGGRDIFLRENHPREEK